MSRRILVPWAMPDIGKEVLKKAKVETIFIHGPKGELPTIHELVKAVKIADVLIPRGTQPVPRKVIMANPNLRGIANYGVGYDNIDVRAASEFGIPVTNTQVFDRDNCRPGLGPSQATARKIRRHMVILFQVNGRDRVERRSWGRISVPEVPINQKSWALSVWVELDRQS
jgi:hypothetical protein